MDINLTKLYYLSENKVNALFKATKQRTQETKTEEKRIDFAIKNKDLLPGTDKLKLWEHYPKMVRSGKSTFTKAILASSVLFDFENVGNFYDDLIDDMIRHFKIHESKYKTRDDKLAILVIYLKVRKHLDEMSTAVVNEIDPDTELSFNIFLDAYRKKHAEETHFEYEHIKPKPASPLRNFSNMMAPRRDFMDGLTGEQKEILAEHYDTLADLNSLDRDMTHREEQDYEYAQSTINDLKRMGLAELDRRDQENAVVKALSSPAKSPNTKTRLARLAKFT